MSQGGSGSSTGGSGSGGGTAHQRWTARLNAFEELTAKWKHVQLSSLQKAEDHATIYANREITVNSRKVVSSRTKDFAKLSDEEKLREIGPLVKSYQLHVDDITKALKFAEKCYLELLEAVQAMTDPYPMMQKFAKERQTILEFIRQAEESEGLRRVVSEREAELIGLRNQEVTIAELRDQLQEAEMEKAHAVRQSNSEVAQEVEDMVRQWQTREKDAIRELEERTKEARKFESMYRDSCDQILSYRLKLEEMSTSREQEIAALVEELDAAHLNLAVKDKALARHDEGLPTAAATTAGGGHEWTPARHDTSTVANDTPSASSRAALMMLEDHNAELQRLVDELKAQLATQAEQLLVERQQMEAKQKLDSQCIASQFEAKIQKLVADLKGAHEEIAAQKLRVKALEDEVARLQAVIRRSESELLEKENQLEGFRKHAQVGGITASAASGQSQTTTTDGSTFSLADVLKESPSSEQQDAALHAATPVQNILADDPYAAIANQRDKLRQRLLALEEASSAEIHRLQMELSSLQADQRTANSRERNPFAAIAILPDVSGSSSSSGDVDALIRRPLLLFQHGKLNFTQEAFIELLDRGNMALSRFVLSNLAWRRGFVAYLGLLHLYFAVSTIFHVLFG